MKSGIKKDLADIAKNITKGALGCAIFIAALGAAEWISR